MNIKEEDLDRAIKNEVASLRGFTAGTVPIRDLSFQAAIGVICGYLAKAVCEMPSGSEHKEIDKVLNSVWSGICESTINQDIPLGEYSVMIQWNLLHPTSDGKCVFCRKSDVQMYISGSDDFLRSKIDGEDYIKDENSEEKLESWISRIVCEDCLLKKVYGSIWMTILSRFREAPRSLLVSALKNIEKD